MHRCFIEPPKWPQAETELSPEESHHLLDVLRRRPGEIIEIFDGCGRTAEAELIEKGKHTARVKIQPETVRRHESYCPAFILLQAIPKHAHMEAIIQKATELGVQKIIPVITERTVVKIGKMPRRAVACDAPFFQESDGLWQAEALQPNPHIARWQKIALAAAKQCQTAWLPEIRPVVPLAAAAAGLVADLKIFGALLSATPSFKEFLAKVERPALKNIALAIGPEGDFTEAETKKLLAADFAPVSFGREVLRVETAALFGLSVLNYEFRETRAEGT